MTTLFFLFCFQAKGENILWYSSLQQGVFVLTSWDESMHHLNFHNTNTLNKAGRKPAPPTYTHKKASPKK